MTLNYNKLHKEPNNFAQLTGLKIIEFKKIVEQMRDDWAKIESSKKSHGRMSHIVTFEDKVLCVFIYYRTYITHTFLGYLFNLHNSNICRMLKKLEPLLA
jgi:hypothetical protein